MMMLIILFSVLANSRYVSSQQCTCPPNGVKWSTGARESCYIIPPATATFDAARAACQHMSPCADLAAVDEEGEKEFILSKVVMNPKNSITRRTSGVWLGAKKHGGHWQWQSTSQIFIKEDPKNDFYTGYDRPDGECLVMWRGFGYKWGDFRCTSRQAYVCEIPTRPSPPPKPTQCSSCPVGFTKWNKSSTGSCYFASSQAKTWDAAVAACKLLSPCARLATLQEPGESNFLKTTVFNRVKGPGFWLNAKKSGTGWMWTATGEAFREGAAHTDFELNDPQRVGDCLIAWRQFGYKWGDYHCNSPKGYVCEVETKKVAPKTTTTSTTTTTTTTTTSTTNTTTTTAPTSTTASSTKSCACPAIYTSRVESTSGSCYFATRTRMTWDEADRICKLLSPCAKLATIDEAGEHDWLATHFNSLGNIPRYGQGGVWVGGKLLNRHLYQWKSTGAIFNRTNPYVKIRWSEPNGDGQCFIMWKTFSYEMGDFPCAAKQGFVCEINTK